MADTAGQFGQTKDIVTLRTVQSFIDMLSTLQGFVSNPALLQQLGQEAAQAYAISTEQQAAHDQLVAEAQTAQNTINTLAAKQADLANQAAQNDADYQQKMQEVVNTQNNNLSDIANRKAALDAQQAALSEAQAQLASDQQALISNQAAVQATKLQQDAREQSLNALEDKINQLKSALGALPN